MSILVYNPFRDAVYRRNNFRFTNDYFTPETDVYESKDEIVVKMNLPGVSKDQISIEANFNELEIKTETKNVNTDDTTVEEEAKASEPEFTAKHIERYNRNYFRKFKFNKPIDSQNAKVNLENGVLTVSLPIRPEAQKISLTIN